MKLSAYSRLAEMEISGWNFKALSKHLHIFPSTPSGERRRHVRVPTDDAAMMRIVQPQSPVRWIVRVVEVSKGGMRMRVPHRLAAGTLIQVHVKNTSVLAAVRHCARVKDEFHAGVEILHMF